MLLRTILKLGYIFAIHKYFGTNVLAEGPFTHPNDFSRSALQINNHVKVFENCTNIIIIPQRIRTIKLDRAPVIVTNTTYQLSKSIQSTFSRQPRKNPSRHCWAVFEFPSKNVKVSRYFERLSTNLIHSFLSPQYLILITTSKFKLQHDMEKFVGHTSYYYARELIIIDLSRNPTGIRWPDQLEFYYYNIYHHVGLFVEGVLSKSWFNFHCLTNQGPLCFSNLQKIGKNVANMNKYFWRMGVGDNVDDAQLEPSLTKWYDQGSNEWLMPVGLSSIQQFVAFWVIQDSSQYAHLNITPIYRSPMLNKFDTLSNLFHFIIQQVQRFSFLSCYKVKPEVFILTSLISPFDSESWLCIGLSVLIIILILSALLVPVGLEGGRVTIGICLENSVLDKLKSFEERFTGQHEIVGVRILIGMWVLLAGTALTNWYKSIFTMEITAPAAYHPSWQSLLDIEGVQVLLPFNFPMASGHESLGFRYMYFLVRINDVFARMAPIGYVSPLTNEFINLMSYSAPHESEFGIDT
ncbi:hypothetical protein Fcan01_20224 [Folsomia candida]|uniref:Uncharacterized protein n=1 Tax=Folsomia candida TaxID=158441 RepID=A0A226DI65_FOLCA|nr:hypothetical protein Fcan01_20224 [Folsomia candida]